MDETAALTHSIQLDLFRGELDAAITELQEATTAEYLTVSAIVRKTYARLIAILRPISTRPHSSHKVGLVHKLDNICRLRNALTGRPVDLEDGQEISQTFSDRGYSLVPIGTLDRGVVARLVDVLERRNDTTTSAWTTPVCTNSAGAS